MQSHIEFKGLSVHPDEHIERFGFVFKLRDLKKIEKRDAKVILMINPVMTIAFGKVGTIITNAEN